MKKLIIVFILGLLAVSMISADKIQDITDVFQSMITCTDEFYANMIQAENGQDVADALLQYTPGMQSGQKAMDDLMILYPELAAMDSPPEKLNAIVSELEDTMSKLQELDSVFMQYMEDPAVIEAMESLAEALTEDTP